MIGENPRYWPDYGERLAVSIGDAKNFENSRQLAAYLGLVPRQNFSGGKQTLLGVSKRGDTYLRMLLIHGARAVIRVSELKLEQANGRLTRIVERRNKNIAAVAPANKNTRVVWALPAHESEFQRGYSTISTAVAAV